MLAGDQYPHVLEMPTYGHSENHVGLQLADVICSALLFPMAVSAYCVGTVTNLHVLPEYGELRREIRRAPEGAAVPPSCRRVATVVASSSPTV